MCWAVSPAVNSFPWQRFFPWFSPIRAAVSGQVCWLGAMFSFSGSQELLSGTNRALRNIASDFAILGPWAGSSTAGTLTAMEGTDDID